MMPLAPSVQPSPPGAAGTGAAPPAPGTTTAPAQLTVAPAASAAPMLAAAAPPHAQPQAAAPVGAPGHPMHGGPTMNDAGAAGTSVNIAILNSKDFPPDVCPVDELYSEFTMVDGRVLFSCPALVKATGIDLMNCPLTVVLKLRVKRRQPGNLSMVLWHVVLPLGVISKYLLQPPHEWETWIGLMPNTQSLEAQPPETMFTQSVHLISRPEYPKLRLRFTYHNPELQAQVSAQLEQQQQESRRRMELTQQAGRASFEEVSKLTRTLRGDNSLSNSNAASREGCGAAAATAVGSGNAVSGGGGNSFTAVQPHASCADPVATAASPVEVAAVTATAAATPVMATAVPVQATAVPVAAVATAVAERSSGGDERLKESLTSTLRFIGDVQKLLEQILPPGSAPPPPLPPAFNEVLAGSGAAAPLAPPMVEAHCQQLQQRLKAVMLLPGSRTHGGGYPGAATAASNHHGDKETVEVEPQLVEGVRMALMGMLEDGDGGKIPRTATNLSVASNDQLTSIQGRFPALWDAYREVSALAKERVRLLEDAQAQMYEFARLQQQVASQREALEASSTESKKFEKLLAQQRQALQHSYDNEMVAVRQQLEDARRAARDREGEVSELRAMVEEMRRQHGSSAGPKGVRG